MISRLSALFFLYIVQGSEVDTDQTVSQRVVIFLVSACQRVPQSFAVSVEAGDVPQVEQDQVYSGFQVPNEPEEQVTLVKLKRMIYLVHS